MAVDELKQKQSAIWGSAPPWQLFSTSFGPSKTLLDSLEPDRAEEYHQATVEFYERYRDGGAIRHPRHYLLTIGRRR
jgi:hypothetical protein